MVTVRINDKARGSKKLLQHLQTLRFVEFEEKMVSEDEFSTLEKQCITGDELFSRVCEHIDELFDVREKVEL